jgi:hypothetical protein
VESFPDGDARLSPPGGPVLDLLRVPDAKTAKNRLHLDLDTTDLAAAVEQALALGATKADDVYVGSGWQVLRDPEGNEFCLLKPATAARLHIDAEGRAPRTPATTCRRWKGR